MKNMEETDKQIIHIENQFNFEAGSINTIIEGGTFNGPVYTTAPTDPKKPTMKATSPTEALRLTIEKMIDTKMLTQKKDFGVTYRLEQEMCLLGWTTYEEYAQRITEIVDIPDELKPTAGNIKSLCVGKNNYPDWNLTNEKVSAHIKAVARSYIREMKEYGFIHQSEIK